MELAAAVGRSQAVILSGVGGWRKPMSVWQGDLRYGALANLPLKGAESEALLRDVVALRISFPHRVALVAHSSGVYQYL